MNKVNMTVNGALIEVEVDGSMRLLDFLRDNLNLTGTKEGCSVGECGACTIVMNGQAVNSCLVLVGQCNGAIIETIENLGSEKVGKALQEAFVAHGGVQCGFCTPGVLMSAKALLDKKKKPTESEMLDALEGNICRCTGYQPIINSIKSVIDEIQV